MKFGSPLVIFFILQESLYMGCGPFYVCIVCKPREAFPRLGLSLKVSLVAFGSLYLQV